MTLFGILVLVSLFKASSAAKTLSMIQFSPQQTATMNNYQQDYYDFQYDDDSYDYYQNNNYSQNNGYQQNNGYPQNNRVLANRKNSRKRNSRY
ncbi:Uncharacterised protein [Mesomycoplasma hyorhinis]|nr:Uncharacterised protein [Mesomycoplasma hyorhinis]